MRQQPWLSPISTILFLASILVLTLVSGCGRKSTAAKSAQEVNPVTNLAFSPDGKTLAAIMGGVVKCWDVESGKELHAFISPSGMAAGLAFSPDSKTLAAGLKKTIQLWDVTSGNPLHTIEGHQAPIVALGFLADGKTLVAAASIYLFTTTIIELWLWDPNSGKKLGDIDPKQFVFNGLALAPDRKSFATGSRDTSVKVWNSSDHKKLADFQASNVVYSMAFSPDGKTLAVADGEPNVTLWDTSSWKEKARIQDLNEVAISCLAFSPDGKSLAGTVDGANMIRIWEVPTLKSASTLQGHAKPVKVLAYSPDGKTLASGGADGEVRFWDVDSGQTRITLK